MRRKAKILLVSYLAVGILALSLYTWVGQRGLGWYRRGEGYSAGLSFEETVRSVQALSLALEKSAYVTDSSMGARVCAEAYARASAAQAAMSVLPFSTQELEQLSGFLNLAGDYTASLCGRQEPLSQAQKQDLAQLSELASAFSEQLMELRQELNDGALRMDSREQRLRNVGLEEDAEALSAELLALEAEFQPPEPVDYDGRFGAAERRDVRGYLTEEEMRSLAAELMGVAPDELNQVYTYEGLDGRRCYRVEDSYLCLSRAGAESLSQTRLVGQAQISAEDARDLAEGWLDRWGFGDLALYEEKQTGGLMHYVYARQLDGVLCPDNCVRLSIALDDGSLYRLDATGLYEPEEGLSWDLDEESAAGALPEGLTVEQCVQRVRRSPGGHQVPCYEFDCTDSDGRRVRITVDAASGLEREIEFPEQEQSRPTP